MTRPGARADALANGRVGSATDTPKEVPPRPTHDGTRGAGCGAFFATPRRESVACDAFFSNAGNAARVARNVVATTFHRATLHQ